MKILGLTGSIGMGKSTIAAMFGDLGVPIWDADGAVHRLYAPDGLGVAAVSARFPAAKAENGGIDRDKLAKLVLNDPESLKALEYIVHPLVGQDRALFLAKVRETHAPMVIVDVPLLFETGGDAYVDKVIVASCDERLQRARVLARPGMNEAKLASILARQMPDAQKRTRADFVVTTDVSLDHTREQVGKLYAQILEIASDKD
jgi:dephospho-CoA kinase